MNFREASVTILLFGLAASAAGQDLNTPFVSWERPTQRLQAATVLVRVLTEPEKAVAAKIDTANPLGSPTEPAKDAKDKDRASTVVVCTGLCVAKDKFVTAVQMGTDSQIRFTFPGGSQGDARLKVIDEFSGLALLESRSEAAAPIELAPAPSAAGSWVMTGSAWGVEKPIVSLGVVGAVDRMLTGGGYPPLLQCDVRTTETSCGAGVVNSQGKLVGVVVGTDRPESQRGWAYAVPVAHVQRLLRVADGAKQSAKEGDKSVIVLKRRRPVVGMQLDSEGDGHIVVRRVTAGGPAEKAGLKIGDLVTATDGIRIRSVYQAILPTLHKQPGDTISLTIEREGKPREILVTLGGGVELPSLPSKQLAEVIQPKVELRRDPKGGYVRQDESSVAESALAADKITILEKALDRYQKVIDLQQQQLKAAGEDRARLEELLEALKSDLESLRQQKAGSEGKK